MIVGFQVVDLEDVAVQRESNITQTIDKMAFQDKISSKVEVQSNEA